MAHGQRTILKGLAVLIRRRPLLASTFLAAAVLTILFGLKAGFYYTYWTDQRQRPVSSWMSVNHISRVWNIEVEDLHSALGLSDSAMNSMPIARIAKMKDKPIPEVVDTVKGIIAQEYGVPPS